MQVSWSRIEGEQQDASKRTRAADQGQGIHGSSTRSSEHLWVSEYFRYRWRGCVVSLVLAREGASRRGQQSSGWSCCSCYRRVDASLYLTTGIGAHCHLRVLLRVQHTADSALPSPLTQRRRPLHLHHINPLFLLPRFRTSQISRFSNVPSRTRSRRRCCE